MNAQAGFDVRLGENAELISTLGGAAAKLFLLRDDVIVAASDRHADAVRAFEAARAAGADGGAGHGGWRWWRHGLALGSHGEDAELWLASQGASPDRQVLEMITRGIERDWRQQATIESLSFELGNRYEELNLLYGMDDSLAPEATESIEKTVGTVLDNCLDFLAIDGAAIHVPEHDIEVYRYCDEARTVLRFAEGDGAGAVIHDRVSAGALVVNGSQESPPALGNVELGFRLLATEVLEGARRVGVLCFLRALESEPFTTSDRKIAEVVAAEVSKALDARFDSVTGLLKRGPFEKIVEMSRVRGEWAGGAASLVQVDLDRFTLINDACGHEAGDRLLRQAAGVIQKFAPSDATVGRLGADEFGVLLPGCDVEASRALAEEVLSTAQGRRFISREKSFEVTVSIGVTALTPDKPLSVALTEVDIACGLVKEAGGNRIRIYSSEDERLQARHAQMQWASKLRAAVDHQQFELFAQAIHAVGAPHGAPAHLEVLLRLFDEEDTLVSPAVFIPAAERYGIMDRIDRLVVETAIRTYADFQARGLEVGLSVNLSGPSIADEAFREFVVDTVQRARLRPGSLAFEITETAAISNLDDALPFIEAVSATGCRFSLDDFGSGMSSYAYLRQLPVDYVKIDGSFVRDMTTDPFNRSIVESIHQISRASGKRTIAEFVEDEATLSLLAEIGVDYAQGYLLGRPAPLEQTLEALLPPVASAV